jgi:Serine dehydrogenase proteinase
MPSQPLQIITEIDNACHAVARHRKRDILILYYPSEARVMEWDIRDTYSELRKVATRENPIVDLDLLIHTNGGDPVAAYRIAQTVRGLCKKLDVLVPEKAYSAGTLMSFAGDVIRLGDYAGLSPIDITVYSNKPQSEDVQLAAIDSFLGFANRARKQIEHMLMEIGRDGASSCVDSDLLVQMVKEVGALTVGRYYRERTVTGQYAEILLDRYMFKGVSDGLDRRNGVIKHFLFLAPAHEFHLDYGLCSAWHLDVEQMSTTESDLTKKVVNLLRIATNKGIICQRLNHDVRMPFIRLYQHGTARKTGGQRAIKKQKHRTGNA